jgi:hypothetical protein
LDPFGNNFYDEEACLDLDGLLAENERKLQQQQQDPASSAGSTIAPTSPLDATTTLAYDVLPASPVEAALYGGPDPDGDGSWNDGILSALVENPDQLLGGGVSSTDLGSTDVEEPHSASHPPSPRGSEAP